MDSPSPVNGIRVVYRPRTDAERHRRIERADALTGTPFIRLPGSPPPHRVLFEMDGYKVRVRDVEMVFNDALLMDAVSNWGEDGPLYRDTLDGDRDIMREAFRVASASYSEVPLPACFKMPCHAGMAGGSICGICGQPIP